MKKRILSFALACLMVASTFIISKPLATIHAVENDVPTYSLPDVLSPVVDSNGSPDAKGNLAVNGNWSARVYDAMATRAALPNTGGYALNTDTRWTFRVGGRTFGAFDSNTGNDAKVCVNPDVGAVPVIVFTAPEDGVYYFDEDVYHNVFVTNKKPIAVDFVVYKGDYAYANLFSAGPAAIEDDLTGYVALKAGEELLFAAERAFYSTSISGLTVEDGTLSGAYINDIVVKKVGELPDGYTDEVYYADFLEDGLSTGAITEGQFTLAAYSYTSNAPVAFDADPVYTASNKRYSYKLSGTEYWLGRSDTYGTATYIGAAIVFKAPKAGYYALSIDANQSYVNYSTKNFWAAEISKSNGKILGRSETYLSSGSGVNNAPANLPTAGADFLEEGEEVYIVIKAPGAVGHFCAFRSVAAVYLGENTIPVDDSASYVLPMDWNSTGTFDDNGWELAVKGEWQLTTFADPTDITTIRNGASKSSITNKNNSHAPESYIDTKGNRKSYDVDDYETWTSWCVSPFYRWDGNPKPFKYGDNRSYMNVNPGRPINTESFSSAAVVFTAPEDGTYSYSELVSQVMFDKSGVPVSVTVAVRKNGELLNAFVPTSTRSSKTLEGTVSLKKGDLLMFTFTLNTEAVLEKEDNVLRLGTTEVKKIGEYAEEEAAVGTKYELPMDWSTGLTKDENGWDLAQKGNWRLSGAFFNTGYPNRFVNIPANISIEEATDTYDIGPAPWIESADNHFNATGTENYAYWDVNGLRRDMSGTLFKYGDNGSFFRLSPRNQEAYACARFPSVIFTAPESGLYTYSTFVSAAAFVDSTGADVEGMVSIRKNGDIIDSFVPTLADAEAILAGTVALKKDEVLMITFHCYKYGDLKSYTHTFNIGDTSITKISSGSGAEVDHSPIFDGTSLTDISGNVKMWGYNTDTKTLYDTSAKGDVEMVLSEDGTMWYAYDPQGTNDYAEGGPTRNFLWHGLVNGPINGIGGNLRTANIGFALVFTAPYDGTFTVNAQLGADYNKHNSSYHDFSIMLEDGTVLTSSDNVGQPDGYVVGLFVTTELKKGEKIIVLKTPSAESTNHNVSSSGTASITITEVNHVCSASTLKHVGAVSADCEDGSMAYYACACGLNYLDANATLLLDDATIPGTGHDTGDYLADQGKHWKHCSTCGEDVEEKAHTWTNGVCVVCKYKCNHEWNGDNVCDNCEYDRTVELAVNAFNNAIDNYFFGGTNEINPVGPTVSLDRFKVALPSGSVTGLTYKLFNLRFDNGEVFLRHHFEVKGDIALYNFTLDGEKVNPVYAGADVYYFESRVALGKLHVPGVIAVSKGNESVEFSVSAYSYLAVALEQSGDADVVNTLKALYDANEAIYTESGDRALLEVTVESANIEKYVSDRTYDPAKEDVTIILVMGQSNFTVGSGYAWEYGFYYHNGKNLLPPENPIVPEKGTVYSFFSDATTLDQFAQEDFVLDDAADMHYLADPSRATACISGTPAAFGTRWHELTGTKVVFLQVAEGSTSIDEWVPNPEDYTCGCNKHGTTYRYSKAVAAYTNAYAALSKNYNVVLSGYIWNQGEGDEWDTYTGTVRDDQTYYDAYKSMHESLVSELGLDFGGISVVRSKLSGSTAEGSASYTIARVGQYRLCNELDDLYMLSTVSETCSHDMLDGSIVHYSQKVHNVMGVEMADNLYSALGYGTANAFDGIKIIAKNGVTITHIDENGELALGTNILTAENTAGRVIIKNSALGREDTVSYKVTINGIDCAQYINAFGLIDWAALEADTGFTSLKVVLKVK